jgi:hypothetical protein
MVKAEDNDAIYNERIVTKLLRVCEEAQEGFVMTDFPAVEAEALVMEEYRGGMNAFVHLSLPDEILVDIEENKQKCKECGAIGHHKKEIGS